MSSLEQRFAQVTYVDTLTTAVRIAAVAKQADFEFGLVDWCGGRQRGYAVSDCCVGRCLAI